MTFLDPSVAGTVFTTLLIGAVILLIFFKFRRQSGNVEKLTPEELQRRRETRETEQALVADAVFFKGPILKAFQLAKEAQCTIVISVEAGEPSRWDEAGNFERGSMQLASVWGHADVSSAVTTQPTSPDDALAVRVPATAPEAGVFLGIAHRVSPPAVLILSGDLPHGTLMPAGGESGPMLRAMLDEVTRGRRARRDVGDDEWRVDHAALLDALTQKVLVARGVLRPDDFVVERETESRHTATDADEELARALAMSVEDGAAPHEDAASLRELQNAEYEASLEADRNKEAAERQRQREAADEEERRRAEQALAEDAAELRRAISLSHVVELPARQASDADALALTVRLAESGRTISRVFGQGDPLSCLYHWVQVEGTDEEAPHDFRLSTTFPRKVLPTCTDDVRLGDVVEPNTVVMVLDAAE
mmetsp:Transcript_61304/g.133190  ORF Transcript_61304/g.133190 Transcript_61304/m.133190 type:complete len:422 (-) Transcript_61304:97-1362(-)